MIFHQDSSWRSVDGPLARTGFLPIPLTSLREIASNNIVNIAGLGGVLCSDTTPIFEYVNGDTDSAMRLRWAAANVDPLVFSMPLPPDVDFSQPLYLKFIAAMGGATNTPTLTAETFFGLGDTKVSDASAAITGTTAAVYTITIAAADLHSEVAKRFASIELTPGAHGADTLLLYAMWMEYTKR